MLHLWFNKLGARGAEYLSNALQINHVSDNFFANSLHLHLVQTLTTLDLDFNEIGDEGTRYLAHALETNTVSEFLYLSIMH
jgi:hypothetical protein